MTITDDWHGCYKRGWGQELTPAAFAHPAKIAYGLAERIYQHCADEGWLQPGDRVVDPFGGIAGFGYHPMRAGLDFIGVELEPKFVVLGQGMDCPGFDKAFWRRCNGRGQKWHKLGICPDCGNLLDNPPPPEVWFGTVSRPVPTQTDHRYHGNIEYWQTFGFPGTARLVRGDSRRLLEVVAGADAAISSPPYATSMEKRGGIDPEKSNHVGGPHSQMNNSDTRYGQTAGQLGALREGDLAAAISSPPFAQSSVSSDGQRGIDRGNDGDTAEIRRANRLSSPDGYGTAPGQLAALREGDLAAAISSPPYAESLDRGVVNAIERRRVARANGISNAEYISPIDMENVGLRTQPDYGSTPGNLGNLRADDDGFAAAVSSPPYETSRVDTERQRQAANPEVSLSMPESEKGYGGSGIGRQRTEEAGETFWAAARVIVAQTFAALRPGGHAVWVVKAFVRDGELVDFPDQWRKLCESAGFVTPHVHRAWLVEDHGTQLAIDGNHKQNRKERKSFFRRLAESKGSPRIDYETIICMEKPGA